MRRIAAGLAAAVAVAACGHDIDPFVPAAPPAMTGALKPNALLGRAEIFAAGQLRGPEDAAVDAKGRIYVSSVADGKVRRIEPRGMGRATIEVFADLGPGATAGMKWDSAGNLLACHSPRGLVAIDADGRHRLLTAEARGQPIRSCNDLEVAKNGLIFFTDSSRRWYGHESGGDWRREFLEARPNGRLLVHDPRTNRTRVLVDPMYFPNGVALSQDESFLLVAETFLYRILRYWLAGPKAGTIEVFADNLPGFPDGITADGAGLFWVAMNAQRSHVVDWLQSKTWLKDGLASLPADLWSQPERYGLVVAIDETGRAVQSLHDPSGHIHGTSNVVPVGEWLYLATLAGDYVARVKRPPLPAKQMPPQPPPRARP
ncbi:MAG: SMP-30/gluconolactonase/LRE family protein [Alphaproteobacteria bacterium]|nr:SMP-30/gluconolactonase/LRE family protein [Alphaproteobacteria bacterium]